MVKYAWIAGFALLVLSHQSVGQSWKEKYLQAQDLYSKESYDQAFALADESLKGYLSEGGTSSETHAAILRLLSTICYVQQKLPQGLDYVEKEIQLRETRWIPRTPLRSSTGRNSRSSWENMPQPCRPCLSVAPY